MRILYKNNSQTLDSNQVQEISVTKKSIIIDYDTYKLYYKTNEHIIDTYLNDKDLAYFIDDVKSSCKLYKMRRF